MATLSTLYIQTKPLTKATTRANMPEGSGAILARRTISNANRNLLDIVKTGDWVLDVGCGSGSITREICDLVGESGFVVGIDPSDHLLELARKNYGGQLNLRFELADIFTYSSACKFNVISSSRVLQWLSNPGEALIKMIDLLKDDGLLTILDYNHEKITWEPSIPESMQKFYQAFLLWRKDAGMDNQLADNLVSLFEPLRLRQITVTDQTESVNNTDEGFMQDIRIWLKVAQTRGKQMVIDGFITEEQRLTTIQEYEWWAENKALSMVMYLVAVTGKKPIQVTSL